jgi:hypothetical protein
LCPFSPHERHGGTREHWNTVCPFLRQK